MSNKESRFDRIDHWPEHDQQKSRSLCKLCRNTSLTHVFCTKCNIYLCFTRQRNCFRRFHIRGQMNQNRIQRLNSQNNKKKKANKKTATKPNTSLIKKNKGTKIAAVYSVPNAKTSVMCDEVVRKIEADQNKSPSATFGYTILLFLFFVTLNSSKRLSIQILMICYFCSGVATRIGKAEKAPNADRELIMLTAKKARLGAALNLVLKQSAGHKLIKRSIRVLNTQPSWMTQNSMERLTKNSEKSHNFMRKLYLTYNQNCKLPNIFFNLLILYKIDLYVYN